jgi:hypothetical protein
LAVSLTGMSEAAFNLKRKAFGFTLRTDRWWVEPLAVLLGLSAFVGYSLWAAWQADHYWVGGHEGFGGYLSPMYSPVLFGDAAEPGSAPAHHYLLGNFPAWWPNWLPASPSFLIFVFPALFRFTCYYYRGAYYKAFSGTPPACAVGSIPRGRRRYRGETFLMIFQNLHRYALYVAILYIPILGYDAVQSFFLESKPGIGVGSIILTLNVTFLTCYTFGCHSWRHLVGGRKDCFSCAGMGSLRYGVYKKSSWLNQRHKRFAWYSLVSVMASDIYVRLVSHGVFTDINTW